MTDEQTAATRVGAAGRVTLPAELRRDLGLSPGDYVVIDIEPLNRGEVP